jgi:hypothetical protein
MKRPSLAGALLVAGCGVLAFIIIWAAIHG